MVKLLVIDEGDRCSKPGVLGLCEAGEAATETAPAAGGRHRPTTGDRVGDRPDEPGVDRDALGGGGALDLGLERFGQAQGEPGDVTGVRRGRRCGRGEGSRRGRRSGRSAGTEGSLRTEGSMRSGGAMRSKWALRSEGARWSGLLGQVRDREVRVATA